MASLWSGLLSNLFDMAGLRGEAHTLVLDIDGTNGVTAPGDATNGLKVNVTTSALPTGAALETTQGEVNAHVHSIDGKITTCNTGAIAGTVTANLGTIADVATQTTLSAAEVHLGSIDASAKKISGETAGTNVHSVALGVSLVVSAAACKVRSAKALNNSGAPLWLHVFDAAVLPANGTLPSRCPIPIPAGQVNGDSWPGSTGFANGCVAALSSTLSTLTVIVANDGWFDAEIV